MHRNRSLRTASLIAVAGVSLAVAANSVSYAAGGPSVRLGKSNHSAHTTTVSSSHGPALSLKSKPSSPSLAVSSKKLVKHLNAQMVGGKTADELEPATKVYSLGTTGGTLPNYSTDQLTVSPGLYRVGVNVINSGGTSYSCYAFPYEEIVGSNYANLIGGQGDFIVSFTGLVKMSSGQHLAIGCDGSGTLYAPARVSIQKLPATSIKSFPTRSAHGSARHLQLPG